MQNFSPVVLALVCLWLIITPRVHTGIFITTGLGMVACGLLAAMDEFAFGDRATRLQVWGVLLVSWGLAWRFVFRPWWLSLSMRWGKAHALARLWGVERRSARRSE